MTNDTLQKLSEILLKIKSNWGEIQIYVENKGAPEFLWERVKELKALTIDLEEAEKLVLQLERDGKIRREQLQDISLSYHQRFKILAKNLEHLRPDRQHYENIKTYIMELISLFEQLISSIQQRDYTPHAEERQILETRIPPKRLDDDDLNEIKQEKEELKKFPYDLFELEIDYDKKLIFFKKDRELNKLVNVLLKIKGLLERLQQRNVIGKAEYNIGGSRSNLVSQIDIFLRELSYRTFKYDPNRMDVWWKKHSEKLRKDLYSLISVIDGLMIYAECSSLEEREALRISRNKLFAIHDLEEKKLVNKYGWNEPVKTEIDARATAANPVGRTRDGWLEAYEYVYNVTFKNGITYPCGIHPNYIIKFRRNVDDTISFYYQIPSGEIAIELLKKTYAYFLNG